MLSTEEIVAANALKRIARNDGMKQYIQNSKDLYPVFQRAAKRFITGETREDGIQRARSLNDKGYPVSLEYIGENTATKEECVKAKNEMIELIGDIQSHGIDSKISFDLSHIGLSVDESLALKHMDELAGVAKQHVCYLMISMEESAKTNSILNIYKQVSSIYNNVGITLQVNLKRSLDDLRELLHFPGKIRLVKGAYKESPEIMIQRSEELNHRYLQFVQECLDVNHPISIATHDEKLLNEIKKRGYAQKSNVEIEMLDGIRPDLINQSKEEGYNTRVYLLYGLEWFLYVCHRLAENPPNIYQFIADMVNVESLEVVDPY
ncbi:proline dehydrogenase family protein [Chengkuizengella axinellae]|uniref:proline dehydrogenase n=1 Tax=Chengkuizengella axinellae TaxID=3064388 RepID=A0ABT9IZU4_9BACL|nr:proline dehydrogenase family protein [Chengkuizengella sp. 2205SS18-9]MDP5274896.1 proline dehydrogenase family protein [Chengkuizengella sp. 2205SS18-9]